MALTRTEVAREVEALERTLAAVVIAVARKPELTAQMAEWRYYWARHEPELATMRALMAARNAKATLTGPVGSVLANASLGQRAGVAIAMAAVVTGNPAVVDAVKPHFAELIRLMAAPRPKHRVAEFVAKAFGKPKEALRRAFNRARRAPGRA